MLYTCRKRKNCRSSLDIAKPGDMVMTIGAGDVNKVAEEYFRLIKTK
jgi:UDP-N-acetylmuramate-alanine ligase